MTGEIIGSESPRLVRFPLYRMVGPNRRVRWLPLIEAGILYGEDGLVFIGGKVADRVESPPRNITPKERQLIIDISNGRGQH